MANRLFILGSINTDLVINTPYVPNKGETLIGSGFFTAHGGKGANQAVAAARSGAKVIMCGALGNDDFGKSARQSLLDEGIDCRHIKTVDGVSSGIAVIVLSSGDNRIILDVGANHKITEKDVDEFLKESKKGDIFLAQLETPISVTGYALKRAKELGLTVILNPAPANKDIIPYLDFVDILTPNENECELLGGVEKLLKKGMTLIVTLGEKGFRIINDKNDCTYPSIKIKPVDTTAAGDTFCGAMIAQLLEGKALEEAAKFGSKAASIACTRKGAQPSIPSKEEVLEY